MSASTEPQLVRCPSCGATNRLSVRGAGQGKAPVCGRCKASLQSAAQIVIVTDANYAEEVEHSRLPVLLDMWAAWCGPCHILAPTVEKLADELVGRIKVAKLNIDENPATTARFGVRSIPTLLVIKDGREVDRIVGVQSKAAILSRLQGV